MIACLVTLYCIGVPSPTQDQLCSCYGYVGCVFCQAVEHLPGCLQLAQHLMSGLAVIEGDVDVERECRRLPGGLEPGQRRLEGELLHRGTSTLNSWPQ